tara:strand:- start:9363 stop:10004 length:642 start_codon:yes stop_codon:yes gene_type:complete
MFSTDEIRQRFADGKMIDRHGFELQVYEDMSEDTMYLRLAHYQLLDGVSAKTVQTHLEKNGLSPVEAKTVVEESLAFIKDVLEIDLEARIKDQRSTVSACNRLLRENMSKLNAWYETSRHEPIVVDDYTFDADTKSREALTLALNTSSVPKYWTDSTNTRLEHWTTVRARQLLTAITTRDTKLHEQMTTLKYAQRTACEKEQLIELQNFKLPE